MSIVDKEKIDSIGLHNSTSEIVLTISDHLDWSDPEQHLFMLQDKINTYIAFIESEEVYQVYPESIGRKLSIEIVSKYEYPDSGLEFLSKVIPVLNSLGVSLKQHQLKE